MQQYKTKAVADFLNHFWVYLRLGGGRSGDFGAITDDLNVFWAHTLAKDAFAHVFAKHDHAGRAAHRPLVQLFPNANEQSRRYDRASYCHIRIHITDVVEIWLDRSAGIARSRLGKAA